jgi:hypothetical protein
MDQSVSQQHAEAYMDVAQGIAAALTSSDARVQELLGDCATATGDAASTCVDNFIASFGKRALRHPLNDAEKAFYRDVYAPSGSAVDKAGLADVITVFLNAPDFIYQVEYGADAVSGQDGLYALSDYEVATRLAFQFWQTTPDDSLLDLADKGELSSDDGLDSALDQVLSSPRASPAFAQFAREWLMLDTLPALDALNADPVFAAFVGDDVPSPNLKEDMIEEVTESFSYHALVKDESLRDWYESPYSFARSDELARIYGVDAWDGKGEPPTFPDKERAGLITRAALLATGSANTRPIMKGVTIRELMLCDTMPPPPANANKVPPQLSPTQTTRQVVEALTEQPGSVCASCHKQLINPLGFATENFDALGRLRDKQKLFSSDGTVVGDPPVDTTSVPQVWVGDESKSSGASDLTKLLVKSGKLEACFARQIVRFAQARAEQESTDGCSLESVRASLTKGDSIKAALRKLVLLPTFRQRLVGPS